MVLNVFSGPKGQASTSEGQKSRLTFDWVVAERPKYIPNSGPPLAPISIMPAHDKDGIILDQVQMSGESLYVVGYEDMPHLRIAVKLQNILNWVSAQTLTDYDSEQSRIQEKLREDIELPIILAKEERRRRRDERKAESESRGVVDGRKRKRTPNLERPRKVGRPRIRKEALAPMGRPSGPGRKNLSPQEEMPFVSPRSQHSQQPSLSTPVRGLAERIIADSDTEDEDSLTTELALEHQLNGRTPRSHLNQKYSGSTTTSPEPFKTAPSRPGSNSKLLNSRGKKGLLSTVSPSKRINLNPGRREQKNYPAILPGMNPVTYTSNREARAVSEEPEKSKGKFALSVGRSLSNFTEKPSPFKPAKTQKSTIPPRRGSSREEEDENEDEDSEPESEQADDDEEGEDDGEQYEVKALIDHKTEVIKGRRRLFYLVHWQGSWDDTWEPAKNIGPEAIAQYRRKQQRLGLDGADSSDSDHASIPNHNAGVLTSVLPRTKREESDVVMIEDDSVDGVESDEDTLFVSDRPQDPSGRAGDRQVKQVLGRLHGEVIDEDTDDSNEFQWQAFGVSA